MSAARFTSRGREPGQSSFWARQSHFRADPLKTFLYVCQRHRGDGGAGESDSGSRGRRERAEGPGLSLRRAFREEWARLSSLIRASTWPRGSQAEAGCREVARAAARPSFHRWCVHKKQERVCVRGTVSHYVRQARQVCCRAWPAADAFSAAARDSRGGVAFPRAVAAPGAGPAARRCRSYLGKKITAHKPRVCRPPTGEKERTNGAQIRPRFIHSPHCSACH